MAEKRKQLVNGGHHHEGKDSEDASTASEGPTKRNKKVHDGSDEERTPHPIDLSKLSRSERKRHREQKRRSDVNKGFEALMTILIQIDPQVKHEAQERARRGLSKGGPAGAHDDNLLSRVDLVNRTAEVLRRIHQENEQRKKIIETLIAKTGISNIDSKLNLDPVSILFRFFTFFVLSSSALKH